MIANERLPNFAADDTIAALATPEGTAALALVRVSGAQSCTIAAEVFGWVQGKGMERRFRHADYLTRDGKLLDDVVWSFSHGPRSYTGEDTLEICTHGNPLIVQLVLADLFSRGCRPAEPGEFTRRAFLNGRMELTQAEAVMDTIHARSERALAAAQQQLRGQLGRRLEELIAGLLGVLARIEAYIDFPDEDLPPEDRKIVRDLLADVLRGTERLLATHRYGDLLRDGLKTVLIGAPNAGKSSLLNALVGRDRAIVSPEPGTTRDFIEERLHVGPHILRLVDTAGLNPAAGTIEQMGMVKTLEWLPAADIILWVRDVSLGGAEAPPAELVPYLERGLVVGVCNKVDLTGHAAGSGAVISSEVTAFGGGPLPCFWVSALTGLGLDALRAEIVARAEALRPQAVGDEHIAINARHADALRRARENLAAAATGLSALPPAPVELVASDIRGALDALGEVAGRVDNERMLDALFATFCIGK
jgi:tRNA modification GTPase